MNNFLEKLTSNIDINLSPMNISTFFCLVIKVKDASFSDKDYILGTKRPWA